MQDDNPNLDAAFAPEEPATPTARPGIAGPWARVREEIDDFADTIARFRQGKVPDHAFLEHRLRFGVYGQRQDGVHMMRSKLPLGLASPAQLEAVADLTERFSAGVAHLTTRQGIQVHFIHLEETPEVMRVLARANGTTREACGNVVRNVCAAELSGVLPGEAFDVTGHGMALARFLLRHPDGQSLGRKFKITLSSHPGPRWDLSPLHDLGALARIVDGVRGFRIKVGGGLGAVPHEAKVLYAFLPEEELLPVSLAVLRVFSDRGEKKNRARARLKFVVAKLGIDAFRELVEIERAKLEPDPSWTDYLAHLAAWDDVPLHPPGALPTARDGEDARWLRTNVVLQRQRGYAAVQVKVPRGDLSPAQLRGLAALLRTHVGDSLRIGVDQSLWLRQVALDRLPAVRDALSALGLGESNPGGISDPVTCPGADTCKLGITSPRAAARHAWPVLQRLANDPRLERIRIKFSGCPNSCSQHQTADIGFFGAARTIGGATAPHFMLLLGGFDGGHGPGDKPGDGFGMPVLKVSSHRIGEVVERLTGLYLAESLPDEVFGAFANRLGRNRFKQLLADLTELPGQDEAPELYREPGSDADFAVVRGTGECAGEVVALSDLLLIDADRYADRAVDLLEADRPSREVYQAAWTAMRIGAEALLATDGLTGLSEVRVVEAFRAGWVDAKRIYEGVGLDFLAAAELQPDGIEAGVLRRLVTEAGLFVEEVHTILGKVQNARGVK